MAEVAASTNGSDAPASSTKKEQMTEIAMALLAQGRRHILVADIPSAVAALAESTQILAEQFGEQADECAESYYQYGIALLEMARTDTDVLGDAVEGGEKENEDGSSEEDGEDDEEEDQKEGEETGEKKTVNGSADTNGKKEHVNGKAEANGQGEASSAAAEKSEDVEMKEDSAQSEKPSEPSKVEQNGDTVAKKEEPSEQAKVGLNGDSEAKKEEEGTTGEASKAETNGDSSTEAKPTIKPKNAAKGKSLKAAGSSTAAITSADETINGDGDDANEDEAEDDVTNLQLAWEVFELAKKIFERKAETDPTAKPRLADSLLRLAEVAIESENYSSAIEDMQKCLEIQKATFPADSRSVAETYYQLGVAYTFTTEFQEAVKSFESAADVIKLRLENLKNPGEKKPSMEEPKNMFHTIEGEIEELESLLPDIRDKIADTIDLEKEAARKLTEQKNGVTTNGAGSSSHAADEASSAPLPGGASESPSSDKPALDITHLIRKKRKPEDGPAEVEPSASKKVCAEPEVADIAS